jgi:periplasmic copper chaperone A
MAESMRECPRGDVMKQCYFASLMITLAGLFIQPVSAQIVLSQHSFEAGQNYAAVLRMEHGDSLHPAPVLQLIAAGAPAAQAPTHYMAGDIMVEQPWSPATPRGAPTAAAYMTIMNHGTSADTLIGGSSPAGKFEVHEMSMTGGVMRMRPVAGGLPIPAGGTVTLNPQGKYHFMLTGLKAPLSQGERVPAVLNFAKAGAVKIELAVAAIGARAPSGTSAPGAANPMPGMDHH